VPFLGGENQQKNKGRQALGRATHLIWTAAFSKENQGKDRYPVPPPRRKTKIGVQAKGSYPKEKKGEEDKNNPMEMGAKKNFKERSCQKRP